MLIAAPRIFDFDRGGAGTWVPVLLSVAMIGLALMTDYALGASRQISMRTHLTIDLVSGALLAVSPWLFGFSDYVWEPHLILGLLEIVAALTTKLYPANERRHRRHTIGAQYMIPFYISKQPRLKTGLF